jgi:hypothetical protein
MIIKEQPKELKGKPLISEKDPRREVSEVYIGRVIIEFWREKEQEAERPAYALSFDGPDLPSEEWFKLFLNGFKEAAEDIENTLNAMDAAFKQRLQEVKHDLECKE